MNYTLRHLLIMMNVDWGNLYYDWMGFKITDKNPLTGHHIKKFGEGGDDLPDNIAALTIFAHRYLHEQIEYDSELYYNLLNEKFNEFNVYRKYPTIEELSVIRQILLDYEQQYYKNIKHRVRRMYINKKLEKYLPDEIKIVSPEGYRLLLEQGIDPVKKHKPNVYKGIRY